MIKITKEDLKYIIKLEQKKYRLLEGKFLIFGKHLIEEARNICEFDSILVGTEDLYYNYSDITDNVYYASKNDFERFKTLKSTPEVVGVCNILDEKNFIEGNILAINKINNPSNLGAILRSAKAFGINNILIDEETVDLYNPKVIQASQGAIFSLRIRTSDLFAFCKEDSIQNRYNIITTYLDEDSDYHNDSKNVKIDIGEKEENIIIIGNEASGLEDKFKEFDHKNFKIDIAYESLNVVVATSIIIYELMKG